MDGVNHLIKTLNIGSLCQIYLEGLLRIYKSLYFAFVHILHNTTTFLELGFPNIKMLGILHEWILVKDMA